MSADSSACNELSREIILEFSGSEDLKDVKLLVLRGLGLKDVRLLQTVPNLVSLSLSHNELRKIEVPAGALPFLEELNVNRNELVDVLWLAMCPALALLYASSNQIADTTPLASLCPRLKCACLHGNRIENLERAVSSLKIMDLEEAELDGNPCAETASYRWTVIDALPKLRRLDSETITDSERSRASELRSTIRGSAASAYGEDTGTFWTHSDIPDPPSEQQYSKSAQRIRRPMTSHQNT